MRRNLLFKNLGVAVAVAAFAFIACDDSSSGPAASGQETSSDAVLSSSDALELSSSEVGTSSAEIEKYSSSEIETASSSSLTVRSSATAESSSAKCGRVPCNSNAPKTVIDCGSGEEYVCADAYWTPMKETESCTRIVGAENGSDGRKCSNKGARTVDCARNIEYECLSAGFWEQINPTIGDICLVDGSILEGYVESSAGARDHTIFMCYEGKWEKYRGAYESLRCVDAAVVRTPCDVNDAEHEWIHQGDCDYQCRDGEYVFVPKLAEE